MFLEPKNFFIHENDANISITPFFLKYIEVDIKLIKSNNNKNIANICLCIAQENRNTKLIHIYIMYIL